MSSKYADALCSIAAAQARVEQDPSAAFDAAVRAVGGWAEVATLLRIAKTQISVGTDPAKTFAAAIAEAIDHPRSDTNKHLSEIALAQEQTGLVSAAHETIAHITEYSDRVGALCAIAKEQTQNGRDSSKTLALAGSYLASMPTSEDRDTAAKQLILALICANRCQEIKQLYDEVLRYRSELFGAMAVSFQHLTERNSLRTTMRWYLPRSARFRESASKAITLLANIYPKQAEGIVEIVRQLVVRSTA